MHYIRNYYFIFGYKLEVSSLKQFLGLSQSLCQGSVLYFNEVQLISFMFFFPTPNFILLYLLPLAQFSLLNQSYKPTSLNPGPSFFAENHSIPYHLSPSPPCPGNFLHPSCPSSQNSIFQPCPDFPGSFHVIQVISSFTLPE